MTMTSGKPGAFETVRYEVDGPVCTITLDRPESANAQNTELIDELDAAFDRADADDDVRVVVLAGEGKHFSAGHDLKELLTNGDDWAKLRDTPEGKLRHEQVMYFDRCVKIRDFRKPTIAAVQGAERFGLVNKVVPRAELAEAARAMADKVALVPPVTAQAVKDSINRMLDLQGQRESWRYHFMVHQFVSNTATALDAAEARQKGGMDSVRAEQRGEKS